MDGKCLKSRGIALDASRAGWYLRASSETTSMNARSWNLLRPPADAVSRLAAELGISPTLATVLANRGAADPGTASAFLDATLDDLHHPLAMRGMTDAVFTVARAVRERRRVLVWGDYDVDGVTATTLLVDFLRRHQVDVGYHIPHRIEEGYGLDAAAIRRHAARDVKLIVTVDCGISDAAAVREARALGIDVVVTDHHEPPAELPDANAVLNPHLPGCRYPFKRLAGVGIAFKLAQALAALIGPGAGADDDPRLLGYLDLVALGTVADIAPLVGENRVLVRHGLLALGASRRPGVRALLACAGIETRPLRAAQIGFGLGPRINAAGRLDRADDAVELLLTADNREARRLAEVLDRHNLARRTIEADIRAEAIAMVERAGAPGEDAVLVLSAPDWHPGVIGIVAAKLAERYARPALLVSTGRDPGRGSARSFGDRDLYAQLRAHGELFAALGGHAHAAGFSIRAADIPRLRRALNAGGAAAAGADGLRPAARRLDIDADLDFAGVGAGLAQELRRLAPFGHGNPEPVFRARGVEPRESPRIVGNNHLRVTLLQKRREHRHSQAFIGFNLGGLAASLAVGHGVDVAYDLDLEGGARGSWDRLRLQDVAPAQPA
jgi:single-stranded-DNA-specific exonuclease